MKTILLMRHAKAERGEAAQRDFDRELAARGRDDAATMGRALLKMTLVPDAIVSSPAARAKQTAEAAARAMKCGVAIRWDASLYDASGSAWIEALRALPAKAESALVVAHAPGIGEAAALLCDAASGSFDVPTAGLLAFEASIERWRDLGAGEASLLWFLRPKVVDKL
ncbi:MAG TPA: histidine phosphatase family protein [Candidatus Polarisedimenticolaceae bacterium]|nr:histidine phosphatase family protein [Candidatus Polarisedimenticolaceae bacterium]